MDSDGSFAQIAQTRQCAGACSDAVEGIARRDIKTIIVAGISPGTDTVSGNDNDVVISASIQGAVTALTLKGAATGSTVVAHGKLGAGFVMINGQEHALDWTDPFSNIVVKQDWNQ